MTHEKKFYIGVKIEVLLLDAPDIITASGLGSGDDYDPDGWV